jgi:hypothetical protein
VDKTEIRESEMTHPASKHTLASNTESVANILERERDALIHEWLAMVQKPPELLAVRLSYEERTGYMPQLLSDVTARLQLMRGAKAPISVAASDHGDLRRKQGYSVAMVVEESRILQVCLFTTLHKNSNRLEYKKLLPEVVTIADEVDAQLKQQVLHFMVADAVDNQSVLN